MLRRIRMVLPLFFAFVLTLLPFQLLEFTQFQRNEVARERDLYLWEQEANNYLQLFSTLWSYELQLKRRMAVFRQNQGERILKSSEPAKSFQNELRKRLPKSWLPEIVYAGRFDCAQNKFKLFRGSNFSNRRRKIFETLLGALALEQTPEGRELKRLDTFCEGALKNDFTFDLLKESRRGKVSYVKLNGQHRLMIWDLLEDKEQKIVYMCFFKAELLNTRQSAKIAIQILAKKFPEVYSLLVPVVEAGNDLKPVFDDRLNHDEKTELNELALSTKKGFVRDEKLPVGTLVSFKGHSIIREFIDFRIPYEIWLIKGNSKKANKTENLFIFAFRLAFFSAWILLFIRVFITARPLGFSIQNWLTLIFMVIGVLPLVVFYIAGSFHLESSAFRQEQQALKEIIRQFEEADVSGESILTEYREVCRQIEMSDSWRQALIKWDKDAWEREVEKLPTFFINTGLKLSACYIYPPPISGLDYYYHSFDSKTSARDLNMSGFYKNWVMKAYFMLAPEMTDYKDYNMQFFEGDEGAEILRLFMGNRADSDFVDLGDEKQFFYQNYILKDGRPINWFFVRANIQSTFENYLKDKVTDWNDTHQEVTFSLAKISYPEAEILLPIRGRDDKAFGLINKHAGALIELSAATRARIFRQTEDRMVVVYPCRKSGAYVLTALMTFRNLRRKVFVQDLLLGIILVLLSIPVFFTSRFIAGYLVKPLKRVESGLKKVAEEDFSSRIHLNRQDELGVLSDAFDHMVDGIIERRNLGRFVSAGLDSKIAREEYSAANMLEKSSGAVLCSDIRSFTTLSEKHSVREIVAMLNEHLTEMSACISANDGLIEQFIGDAVLAVFFGDSEKEAAQKAVNAAIQMMKSHHSLIDKRKKAGKFVYEIGVGIEAGKLVSGVLKANDKNEYVLIGQSRSRSEYLESKSKLGTASRIVCSENVSKLVDNVEFVKLSDEENFEIAISELQT
ncbi:MAG: adenylate cyclase [Clostridiales bacterium]|nr:adenylate cyclase [Clostridiales bacterium]MDN5282897.1 adenylate cyclase [Candidatus Ozemobacter sp.]